VKINSALFSENIGANKLDSFLKAEFKMAVESAPSILLLKNIDVLFRPDPSNLDSDGINKFINLYFFGFGF